MIAILELVALVIIIAYAICGLNHMSRSTHVGIVVAVSSMFSGAVARAWLLITSPQSADLSVVVVLLSVAIGMVINRRREHRYKCLLMFDRQDRRNRGVHA